MKRSNAEQTAGSAKGSRGPDEGGCCKQAPKHLALHRCLRDQDSGWSAFLTAPNTTKKHGLLPPKGPARFFILNRSLEEADNSS